MSDNPILKLSTHASIVDGKTQASQLSALLPQMKPAVPPKDNAVPVYLEEAILPPSPPVEKTMDIDTLLHSLNMVKMSSTPYLNQGNFIRTYSSRDLSPHFIEKLNQIRQAFQSILQAPNQNALPLLTDMQNHLQEIKSFAVFDNMRFSWIAQRLYLIGTIFGALLPSNSPLYSTLESLLATLQSYGTQPIIKNPNIYHREVDVSLLQQPYLQTLLAELPTETIHSLQTFRKNLQNAIYTNHITDELLLSFKTLNSQATSKQTKLILQLFIKLGLFSLFPTNSGTEKLKTILTQWDQSFTHQATANQPQEIYQHLWQMVRDPNFLNLHLRSAEESKNIEKPLRQSVEVKRNDLFPFITHYELQNNFLSSSSTNASANVVLPGRINVVEPFTVGRKDEHAQTSVTAIDWKEDTLSLGYEDGQIKLWQNNADKYKLTGHLDGHTNAIRSLIIYRDHLISSSEDMTITIWNLRTQKYQLALRGHKASVTSLYAGWVDTGSGAVEVIISGSDDGSIKVWSFKTGNCLKTLDGHSMGITSLQVAFDLVIAGSRDQAVRVWDLTQGTCLFSFKGHTGEITSLVTDGKQIISGSTDRTLRIWDLDRGGCTQVLYGHHAAVSCIYWTDQYLASGSADRTIRIWNRSTYRSLKLLKGHTEKINCICIRDHRLLSGANDQSLFLWDLAEGACISQLNGSSTAKELYQHQ